MLLSAYALSALTYISDRPPFLTSFCASTIPPPKSINKSPELLCFLELINISLVCTNLIVQYSLQLHIQEARIKLTEYPLHPIKVLITCQDLSVHYLMWIT